MRTVNVKHAVHDRGTARVGEQFAVIADESAGRGVKDQPRAAATGGPHLDHLGFALGKLLHHHTGMLLVDVDDHFLDRLEQFAAVALLEQNLRPRDRKLEAFAPHGLDENAELQFAAAGNLHGIFFV